MYGLNKQHGQIFQENKYKLRGNIDCKQKKEKNEFQLKIVGQKSMYQYFEHNMT